MPTKADLKHIANLPKSKLRKGDRVVIIAGKDKGEEGFVAAISPKEQKVIVLRENTENPDMPIPLNAVVKHRKARSQSEKSARIQLPAPLHISNVMLVDAKGNATRVGRRKEEGKLVRYSKKSNETLVDAPVMGDHK
jgi:large subunit ribosomal protein L24